MTARRLVLTLGLAALGAAAVSVALEGRAAPGFSAEFYRQFGLALAGLFGLLAWAASGERAGRAMQRVIGEATAETLGAIRILICAILLVTVLMEHLPSVAALPPDVRWGMGFMRLFYLLPIGFDRLVQSPTALALFQATTALLLLLGLVGWRTRLVLPAAVVFYYAMFGILRQYSFFWHQGLVPLYALAVLSLSPCGDAFSVDRLKRVWRGEAVPPTDRPAPAYSWARYGVWMVLALTYGAAGLSKLRDGGLFWGNAVNMRAILYGDSLDPMRDFNWGLSPQLADLPDALFLMLGICGMYGELLYPLVLVSRWARVILPAAMFAMHLGILFLQNILFVDLMLMQLVFVDVTALRRAVGRRLAARRGRIEVLYDGRCALCRRTVRILGALDLFERLAPRDFRRLDLEAFGRARGLALTSADVEAEMYVIDGGRAYAGVLGYRVLARALPAFWPLAPWLFLPGVTAVGERVYGWVARNRQSLVRCDDTCRIDEETTTRLGEPDGRAGPSVRPGTGEVTPALVREGTWAGVPRLAPLGLATLGALMVASWAYRVEFYPFTAVAMYSVPRTEVVYYKALARRGPEEPSRARFEEMMAVVGTGLRYRHHMRQCFEPARMRMCERYLLSLGTRYNALVPPEARLAGFDIQKWVWDFTREPGDPDRGRMVGRYLLDLHGSPPPMHAGTER